MTKSKSWSANSCQEFATAPAGIYLEVFAENFQGERVDFARRSFPGAPDFKAVAAERAKQILGQDASLRVTSAEKQNTKR